MEILLAREYNGSLVYKYINNTIPPLPSTSNESDVRYLASFTRWVLSFRFHLVLLFSQVQYDSLFLCVVERLTGCVWLSDGWLKHYFYGWIVGPKPRKDVCGLKKAKT